MESVILFGQWNVGKWDANRGLKSACISLDKLQQPLCEKAQVSLLDDETHMVLLPLSFMLTASPTIKHESDVIMDQSISEVWATLTKEQLENLPLMPSWNLDVIREAEQPYCIHEAWSIH